MKISGITATGPAVDDRAFLSSLPAALQEVLADSNGFIILQGALHVRGVCSEPEWHSLRHAWHGDKAFHKLYDAVTPDDIPFAQDCVGDQFLLRDGHVVRLLAETGEIEGVAVDLQEFFAKVDENPVDFPSSAPDHPLQPGQLLHAYPPFCVKASASAYSLKACPAHKVILFHADFARQIAHVPEGGQIEIEVTD
ncbi:MAG: SMI1/KNR4 family protein [Planctomycetaceae bacterium]|nr:SMI1/KNR4 family protein [Planctomycetaceae bacterium]